jgi:hypothetical protein
VKTEEEKRLCELLIEILVNRLERPVMQQLGEETVETDVEPMDFMMNG